MTETRERLEETVRDAGGSGRDDNPVTKTITTAVVAAAFAGLASAAKALLERRREGSDAEEPGMPHAADEQDSEAETDGREHEAEADEDEPEPEADADEPEPEAEADDEEPEPEAEADDEEREADTDDEEPAPEAEADDEEPEMRAGRDEEGDIDEGEPRRDVQAEDGDDSGHSGNTAEIVAAARHELEELLGHDVESVSSFERADDGWRVTLEVVDLRRVPDSSDVLSSYEVVIDDDRQLVSLDRSRRYRRAQVDPE